MAWCWLNKRAVPYAAVDPVEARGVFILEALVHGALDTRRSFAGHNRLLREEVDLLEQKRRNRDVLVDDADLFAFFDARIPADVASARKLEKWLAQLGEDGRRQMLLSHDVLVRDGAGDAPLELYPDYWEREGNRFALSYHFAPGDPADGVSITVPMELLNTLDAGELQWLVPGMLRDKVVEIIRNLPKPVRRALTPAPQFADAAVARMSGSRDAPLLQSLATTLTGITGLELTASMLAEAPLPDHLQFRIVLIDEHGKVMVISRDLADLQEQHGKKARRRFMDQQGSDWNRDGETAWVFGELPVSLRTRTGNQAWPALLDQQQSVGLRLYDTAGDAAYAHMEGVRRLLAIGMSDKLRYLEKHHGINQQALMVWSAFGSNAELIQDLVWSCLCAVADHRTSDIRDQQAFDELLGASRSAIGAEFQRRAKQLEDVLGKTGRILKIFNAGLEEKRPETYHDLSSQLEDMVYEGFLRDLEPGRFQHYPRYLQAMQYRLQQQELDPARDARLMSGVRDHWARYLELIQAGVEYGEELDHYRWLLEEYRVSLFAQKLGTAEKTSIKRLSEAWRNVQESV